MDRSWPKCPRSIKLVYPGAVLVHWVRLGLSHRLFPLAAAVIGVLLLLPALSGGFQLDDHYQRFRLLGLGDPAIQLFVFYDGDPERNLAMMEAGSIPWWSAPELRHANLRYLSVLTMQLDYALWPHRPELQHLHSLVWLGALIAAAGLLYRQVLGATWVAGLAALLYAIDEAHALPAAYLANRNALIATCFGALCLWSFARWRTGDSRRDFWLAPAFLALAMAAGEIALGTAAYLFAYVVCLERGPVVDRVKALLPCGVVLLAWALVYKLGGFGASGSGFYRDPLGDPLSFALGFLWRAPVLLLGQWTPMPADNASASAIDDEGRLTMAVAGAVFAGVMLLALLPILRRDRSARFWGLGSLLSLVPVAATGPQNRLLFFVGLGSFALLAQLVQALVADRELGSRGWRVTAGGVALLALLVHLVVAPLAMGAFIDFHKQSGANMQRALDTVPRDPAIASQTLVVVNPPDYTYVVGAIQSALRTAGVPAPPRVRALSAGSSDLEVGRVDANTLRVRLPLGLFPHAFSRYYRGSQVGFSAGDRLELSDLTIEIEELNANGDPEVIVYRFHAPLEDPSLRWLRWLDGAYVPWTPPPPGSSETLPPSRSIFAPDL